MSLRFCLSTTAFELWTRGKFASLKNPPSPLSLGLTKLFVTYSYLRQPRVNFTNALRAAFAQHKSQKRKKTLTTWLSFSLMGSSCIKYASKYVGEIDPWRNFFNTSVTTTYLMLSKFIPIELSIIGLNCINLTLWERLKFRFRKKWTCIILKLLLRCKQFIACFDFYFHFLQCTTSVHARTHSITHTHTRTNSYTYISADIFSSIWQPRLKRVSFHRT